MLDRARLVSSVEISSCVVFHNSLLREYSSRGSRPIAVSYIEPVLVWCLTRATIRGGPFRVKWFLNVGNRSFVIFFHDSRCVPRSDHGIFHPVPALLFFSKSVFWGRCLKLPN